VEPVDIYIYVITIFTLALELVAGSLVIKKYFEHKHPTLLYYGLSFIFVASPWMAYAVNFTIYLISGSEISIQAFYLIGYSTVLLASASWVIGTFTLIYTHLLKLMKMIMGSLLVIYYVFFLIFIFTNMDLIGTTVGFWKIQYGIFTQLFITVALLTFLVTILLFVWDARESPDPEIRLKAKLLLFMGIFFGVASGIEIVPFFSPVLVIVSRTMLSLAAICLYMGTVLPAWAKKLFLRTK